MFSSTLTSSLSLPSLSPTSLSSTTPSSSSSSSSFSSTLSPSSPTPSPSSLPPPLMDPDFISTLYPSLTSSPSSPSSLSSTLSSSSPTPLLCVYDSSVPIEIRISTSAASASSSSLSSASDTTESDSSSPPSLPPLHCVSCCRFPSGEVQSVRVRIFVPPVLPNSSSSSSASIFVTLSHDDDLYFYLAFQCDESLFTSLQNSQKFFGRFDDFPSVLKQNFTSLVSSPTVCVGILYIRTDANPSSPPIDGAVRIVESRMDFVQNLGFKFVEMLSFPMLSLTDEMMKLRIEFRYAQIKRELKAAHMKFGEIHHVMKAKTPALLKHIKVTPDGMDQQHGHRSSSSLSLSNTFTPSSPSFSSTLSSPSRPSHGPDALSQHSQGKFFSGTLRGNAQGSGHGNGNGRSKGGSVGDGKMWNATTSLTGSYY